jgi:hypothetical protein
MNGREIGMSKEHTSLELSKLLHDKGFRGEHGYYYTDYLGIHQVFPIDADTIRGYGNWTDASLYNARPVKACREAEIKGGLE